jgi:hypothetical protein
MLGEAKTLMTLNTNPYFMNQEITKSQSKLMTLMKMTSMLAKKLLKMTSSTLKTIMRTD